MAATVGALRITLGANTANFEAGMKRARREAANSSTAIQRSLSGIRSGFSAIGAGIIAGIGIGAFASLTKRALDYAGGLGEVAQQLGVTTKGLQEMRYAASQTGVAQETLDKGLAKLNLTLSQARAGAEAPKKAFQELSRITGVEIVRSSRDAEQVLRLLADAYVKTGKGSDLAAVGAAVMGRNFQKLQPLLSGGKQGIDDLAESAAKLGLILSDEQIQRADETADKLEELKRVLEARIAGIVADNAESILALATSLANLAAGLARFWSQDPERALSIVGALGGAFLGGRLAGLPGAIAGGIGGMAIGGYAGRQNPAGVRAKARGFLDNASRIGRARGFFDPGTTQAQKDAILKDPGIQANLRQFKAYMAEAQKMAVSGSIAAPALGPLDGGVDVGNFLGGGGGRKGRSSKDDADRQREEALKKARDLDRAIADAKSDELQAQQALLDDYVERGTIERELVDIEIDQRNKDLELSVALGDMNETVAAQFKAANERLRILKKQEITQQVELDRQRDFEATEQTRFDIQRELLQAQAALAETAAERRAVELQILDLAYRERKERLERIIAESRDEEERKRAQMQLDAMPGQRRADTAGIVAGTRGPLEEYAAGLPSTAAKMNEALQMVAVDGLRALEDGILSVIDGTKSLGEAFRDMASQIIADLLRIQIQRAFASILSSVFNVGAAAAGGGGGFTPMPFIGAPDLHLGAFNSGGYTGNMSPRKVAGFVHGREFVFDDAATRRIGVGNLERLRKGAMTAANDRGSGKSGDVYQLGDININAPMSERQARQTGSQAASEFQRRVAMTKRSGI